MTTERAHARLCPEAHRSEQHEAGAAASYDGATRFVYLAHIHIHLFDTHERRLENPVLSVSLVCAVAIWHLAHIGTCKKYLSAPRVRGAGNIRNWNIR